MTEHVRRSGSVAGIILAGATLFALLLALPGETVTVSYLNDLFIFLDGAHRIASGQVPNRDFHTALGPLVFYIPALGYWLSGTMGGAMPTGMAVVTIILALPMAYILSSRLRPVMAILFGILLLLILAAPVNLGESVTALSFAMFYNRIGWAALSLLLIMYLQPDRPRRFHEALDAACATALTLALLYTKVTYGGVALAFLALMLFDRTQRRWAASAIGLTLIGCLIVEAFWQSSQAYLADLMLTSRVSGSRGLADLATGILRHLADYTILAMLAFAALWRSFRVRDLLFFGFCAGSGLLIHYQNSQPWGIITLHAGAAVAIEMPLRSETHKQSRSGGPLAPISGTPLLLAAIVLPTLLHGLLALGLHSWLAASRSGEALELPQFSKIRLASPWLSGERTLMHIYLDSIRSGAGALERLPEKPGHIFVLDFVNPFSAGFGLPPPRGDSIWLHWGRNIDAAHFIPPEELFKDVEVLMLPAWGINHIPLRNLYQGYIDRAFEPLLEAEGWSIHRKKKEEVATKSQAAGEHAPSSRVGAGDGMRPWQPGRETRHQLQ